MIREVSAIPAFNNCTRTHKLSDGLSDSLSARVPGRVSKVPANAASSRPGSRDNSSHRR